MTLLIYTNFPKKFKTRKEFKRHKLSNYELYESRPRKMIEFGHVCQESPQEKSKNGNCKKQARVAGTDMQAVGTI